MTKTDTLSDASQRSSSIVPTMVALIGFGLTAYIAIGLLLGNAWNPTIFLKFSAEPAPITDYASQHLVDVVFAGDLGHDGKFFFVQANDPLYLDPDHHAVVLDRPTYRAQRMLYPLFAGGFGLFTGETIAWSMLLLNLFGVGVGTFFTARVAMELELSPLFGLAFFVNPGIFVSSVIDTAEVWALAFLVAALLMIIRRRIAPAAILMSLAALTRETMLICAIGWVLFELLRNRRLHWVMTAPFLSVGAWWLYLRVRLGHLSPTVQDTEALGTPFRGMLEAFSEWVSGPGHLDELVIGVSLVFICAFFTYLAITRRSLIPLMSAGFALLAVVMVAPVWSRYFDATRALTPMVTFFFLSVPFTRHPRDDGVV